MNSSPSSVYDVSDFQFENCLQADSRSAILKYSLAEVRCATLATVTYVASLSAQFAANCQDLLVDMLTDDIQEVRLAAIRALGAVGDQVCSFLYLRVSACVYRKGGFIEKRR